MGREFALAGLLSGRIVRRSAAKVKVRIRPEKPLPLKGFRHSLSAAFVTPCKVRVARHEVVFETRSRCSCSDALGPVPIAMRPSHKVAFAAAKGRTTIVGAISGKRWH